MLLKKYIKINNAVGLYKQAYSPFSKPFFGVDEDALHAAKQQYEQNKPKFIELGLNLDNWFDALQRELAKTTTYIDPRELRDLAAKMNDIINEVSTKNYKKLTELSNDSLSRVHDNLSCIKSSLHYKNNLGVTAIKLLFPITAVLVVAASIAAFLLIPLFPAMIISTVATVISAVMLELPHRLKLHDRLNARASNKSNTDPLKIAVIQLLEGALEKYNILLKDINTLKNYNKNTNYKRNTLDACTPIVTLDGNEDQAQYYAAYSAVCRINHALSTAKNERKSLQIKIKHVANMQYNQTGLAETIHTTTQKIDHLKKERNVALEKFIAVKTSLTPRNNVGLFSPTFTTPSSNPKHECKPWKSPFALGTI